MTEKVTVEEEGFVQIRVPKLAYEKEHVDEMIDFMKEVLQEIVDETTECSFPTDSVDDLLEAFESVRKDRRCALLAVHALLNEREVTHKKMKKQEEELEIFRKKLFIQEEVNQTETVVPHATAKEQKNKTYAEALNQCTDSKKTGGRVPMTKEELDAFFERAAAKEKSKVKKPPIEFGTLYYKGFPECKLKDARNVLNSIGIDVKTVESVMFLGPDVIGITTRQENQEIVRERLAKLSKVKEIKDFDPMKQTADTFGVKGKTAIERLEKIVTKEITSARNVGKHHLSESFEKYLDMIVKFKDQPSKGR